MKIDSNHLANSFSKAAKNYDSQAYFQQQVGCRLLAYLNELAGDFSDKKIMDLGCGTGFFTKKIAEKNKVKKIIGMDIAYGMVVFSKHSIENSSIDWVCADAKKIPVRNESFDAIFSNLTLQWCDPFSVVLSEIHRILMPSGLAVITTLLDPSLFELKQAWLQVDDDLHANEFLSKEQLKAAINPIEFSVDFIKTERITLEFPHIFAVMQSLKNIGASNHRVDRKKGLTTRKKIQKISNAYQQFLMPNGCLPLSYEVAYLLLRKVSI